MINKVGLTNAKIEGLKPPSQGQIEYADKLIAGLRVRIGSSGTRTYILRKRIGRRVRNITLGRHTARFRLKDARKKARDLLVDIEAGQDPTTNLITPRKNGGFDGSLGSLVERYLANVVRGRKRSAKEIERVFDRYILPKLGDRLADTISRGDISKLVEEVAFEGPRETPRMARSVHQQLSAFYTWAMPKLDQLPANPCRDAWRPGPSKARERVLSDIELRLLWDGANQQGSPFGPIVQLLILTAQRRSEVIEAEWSEFDLQQKVWTISAERSKNGRVNIVPLAPQAIGIIEKVANQYPLRAQSRFLFPSLSDNDTVFSGVSKSWARLKSYVSCNMEGEVPHFTIHDIRRTATTGFQRLGVPLVVSEAVLNHQSGSRSGVAGIYHRHDYADEKRGALVSWADFVEKLIAG